MVVTSHPSDKRDIDSLLPVKKGLPCKSLCIKLKQRYYEIATIIPNKWFRQ